MDIPSRNNVCPTQDNIESTGILIPLKIFLMSLRTAIFSDLGGRYMDNYQPNDIRIAQSWQCMYGNLPAKEEIVTRSRAYV